MCHDLETPLHLECMYRLWSTVALSSPSLHCPSTRLHMRHALSPLGMPAPTPFPAVFQWPGEVSCAIHCPRGRLAGHRLGAGIAVPARIDPLPRSPAARVRHCASVAMSHCASQNSRALSRLCPCVVPPARSAATRGRPWPGVSAARYRPVTASISGNVRSDSARVAACTYPRCVYRGCLARTFHTTMCVLHVRNIVLRACAWRHHAVSGSTRRCQLRCGQSRYRQLHSWCPGVQ